MADIWQAGRIVGRGYRLERLIGRGALGEVWLAVDVNLGRQVAIKGLFRVDAQSGAVERFAREARLSAILNHPAIVRVYDVGRDDETRYIVMEYVAGESLDEIIHGGEVNVGWGLHVARQIAEAINYAHDNNVLHRDIKPSNILVESDKVHIKLTDFGIAKDLGETATVTLAGTPGFMSPEQFTGSHVGPKVDIYSFGATLYNLFTGLRPPNVIEIIGDNENQRHFPAPAEIRKEIPKKLSSTIISMMELDWSKRPSVNEVIQVLDSLIEKLPFPSGDDVYAVRAKRLTERDKPKTLTRIDNQEAPTGFFDSKIFPKSNFFQDDVVRYTKIQESLNFYREHLHEEYQSLLKQAKLTYWLWLGCVILGFLTLVAGVATMLAGNITEGIATAASTIIVFFIQRIFQQREDHYRSLAKVKNSHLEYGNQWLLIIQSIDSIDDVNERAKRQARLIDVLTDKLISNKPELS